MDARNSQNTRLSKKKGSCRRPIIYIYMSYYPLLYSRMTHYYYYYYYYYYYVFNVFSLVELGTKLPQKPWTQELAKIPNCPRRNAIAEFRLCVGRDCLGTSPPHWNLSRPLLHAVQPPRNHGQKPSKTMYRVI